MARAATDPAAPSSANLDAAVINPTYVRRDLGTFARHMSFSNSVARPGRSDEAHAAMRVLYVIVSGVVEPKGSKGSDVTSSPSMFRIASPSLFFVHFVTSRMDSYVANAFSVYPTDAYSAMAAFSRRPNRKHPGPPVRKREDTPRLRAWRDARVVVSWSTALQTRQVSQEAQKRLRRPNFLGGKRRCRCRGSPGTR